MLKVIEKEYQGKKYKVLVFEMLVNGVVTEIPLKCNTNLEKALIVAELEKKGK